MLQERNSLKRHVAKERVEQVVRKKDVRRYNCGQGVYYFLSNFKLHFLLFHGDPGQTEDVNEDVHVASR